MVEYIHFDSIVMQIKDIYDGDHLVVGPYDWSWCTNLAQLINKPDEYFRKVSSLLWLLCLLHFWSCGS